MATHDRPIYRKAKDYRWDGVDELPYKEADRALFKTITRQVLFSDPEMHSELRYFAMAPGGFSAIHFRSAAVPSFSRPSATLELEPTETYMVAPSRENTMSRVL